MKLKIKQTELHNFTSVKYVTSLEELDRELSEDQLKKIEQGQTIMVTAPWSNIYVKKA